MTTDTVDYQEKRLAGLDELGRHWGWLLALGVVWTVLGLIAIILPFVAGLALNLTLGVLFAIGGIAQLVQAARCRGWNSVALHIVGGLLALLLGGLLLFYPLEGVLTLTVFLAAFFIAQGALKVWSAFQNRPLRNWGWVLASGVISVAIGLLIAFALPGSAAWALGLLVGVELVFTGVAMSMLALSARDA